MYDIIITIGEDTERHDNITGIEYNGDILKFFFCGDMDALIDITYNLYDTNHELKIVRHE